MLQFRRNPLDEPATIRVAAEAIGLDPDRAVEWTTDSDVARETAADATAARTPPPEALAQPERLSAWDGGLRYSCPSYEIVREADGARLIAPGWQETRTYEMAIANLAPRLERREDADDALAVLTWAGEPLATREVAAVMSVEPETARERLRAAGAHFAPVAADGYWTAP
ncbi:MAG TPA: hypothetical protein PKE32_00615 [Miltoncostaeaceae bacterium]|nr:hypothetical protein [Miltoncostaeaceae bacterium]